MRMVIRCIVPGCRSTSSRGFLLKRFPRDLTRRDIWYANIPKHNWEATDNTYICEIHFEDHHWEQNRVDRLKPSAIPTIFKQQCNYVKRRQRTANKAVFVNSGISTIKVEEPSTIICQPDIDYQYLSLDQNTMDFIDTDININNNIIRKSHENKKISMSILQNNIKVEKDTKKNFKPATSTRSINDEKDLLIAQLQDQVAKQRECIAHYESIVQLMNYRIMKLKKVLKAHKLLKELD